MKFGDKLILIIIAAIVILAVILWHVDSQATNIYVSNSGFDSNGGHSTVDPFQTCNQAMSHANDYDTINFMGGTYAEANASGFASPTLDGYYTTLRITKNGLTIRPAPGYGMPTFRGYGSTGYDSLHVPTEMAIDIAAGVDSVTLDSVIVKWSRRGIRLNGGNTYIKITNCVVCSTGNTWSPGTGSNNNAGIIGFLGTSKSHHCTFRKNTLFHNYEYPVNLASQVNQCGFDLYWVTNSTIDSNIIYDQPYPTNGGIYLKNGNYPALEGGVDSNDVSYNTIYNCYIGINICHAADYNNIHHNTIFNSDIGIVHHGPYPAGMTTDHNTIYNNTIYFNGTLQNGGQSLLGIDLATDEGNINYPAFFNNIVMSAISSERCFGYTVRTHTANNFYSDYNCFYNSATTTIIDRIGTSYTLANYQAAYPADEVHTINVNPQFQNAAGGNFNLTASSSATLKTGGVGGSYPTYMGSKDPSSLSSSKIYYPIKRE